MELREQITMHDILTHLIGIVVCGVAFIYAGIILGLILAAF